MTLDEAVKKVRPLDEKAMEGARKRWDSIAKPLHSLGELENKMCIRDRYQPWYQERYEQSSDRGRAGS